VAVQYSALLRRHMRFVAVGIVEVVAITIGVGAGIISAVSGLGHWSLLVMHLAVALSSTVGYWIAFPWCPGLPRKGSELRALLGFGSGVTGVQHSQLLIEKHRQYPHRAVPWSGTAWILQ